MFDFIISSAHAQAATTGSQTSMLTSMIPFVLIFFVMYFLMIRPQKKRMQEEQKFINELKQGLEVVTKSGILGKVTGIAEKVVTLELESGAKLKVLKSHIGGSAAQIFATPEKK